MFSLRGIAWTLVLVPVALLAPQQAWGSSANVAPEAFVSPPAWDSGFGIDLFPGPISSSRIGVKTLTYPTDVQYPLAESSDDAIVSDHWDAWQSWPLLASDFDLDRDGDSVWLANAVRADVGLQSLSFPPSPRAPPVA